MLTRFLPRWLIRRPELVILTLLAALTRFWQLFSPSAVVFDEVYFKEYAGHYLAGTYYFDIHPPLGKLLLAGTAWLLGLSGPDLISSAPAVGLRLLPALAGTLLIPLFYVFLRQLRASRRLAALGAALLLLDNALLVESRFILMDSLLLLFGLGALVAYLAARRRQGWRHWAWLVVSGIGAGATASIKWTGLAILGLILLAWFVEAPAVRHAWRRLLAEASVLILVPAAVYIGVFAVHFALLPQSGPGDGFMSIRFQSTLVGNRWYDPSEHMSFIAKFIDLNRAMNDSEASLKTATHPYGSPWYSWPIMKRPIYYWQGPSLADGRQGNIYLLGNPFIWWGVLGGLATTTLVYLWQPARLRRYRLPLLFLAAGYIMNFAPFSQIHRVMFLYHYFFAFIFSLAIAVLGYGILAGWNDPDERFWHFPSRISGLIYIGVIAIAVLGFLYFAPLSYGWPLSPSDLMQHVWLPTWR